LFNESEVSELPALLDDRNRGISKFTDPQIDREIWING